MIGSAGKSTRTRRITSNPLIPGSPRSSSTRSNDPFVMRASASSPLMTAVDDVVLGLERDAQRPQDGRLVVDDEDPGALHGLTGSSTVNVAPPPGVGSTRMCPPCASTKPREIASPSPVPARRSWPGRSR